jgi:SAM-dependent methyltransferase
LRRRPAVTDARPDLAEHRGGAINVEAEHDWRALFEREYALGPTELEDRLTREALGDEYPEGLAIKSFVSRSDLARFVAELHVGPWSTLVDVGCGRGGPGVWVAAQTGATLIGLDIAEAPLGEARQRAVALGVAATFQRGEFEATGLPDEIGDAVMSVDALLFTTDKATAFRELRRILRPGGRLALTSWDYHTQPVGRPPQLADHRPVAEAAGFRVLVYDETPGWRESEDRFGELLLEHVEEIAAASGDTVEEVRAEIEEENATGACMIRRFFLVAEAV